jgi:hypothetical protein
MKYEIWKDIPGYNGFQVSNAGRVKRLPFSYGDSIGRIINVKENIITSSLNKKGYVRVELCIGNGKKKAFTVHRLVMLSFKGFPPNGMDQINHLDGVKTNNSPDNLEWSNNSLNIKHAWKIGLFKPNLPSGLRSPHSVILVHSGYGVFCNLLEASFECKINRSKLARMVKNIIPNTSKYILA